MADKKPTQEQIKELWEWCGFYTYSHMGQTDIDSEEYQETVYDPNGKVVNRYPKLDLNNLFKYAVPKAVDKIMQGQECSSDIAYAILFKKWLQKLELDIPNHEGTLFWTIWEVK